ncbi:MAG: transcriptional regulator [Planctomycetota bacterium]|nr:transcriptional regulator [Planctomycetota bacterium]
MTEKGKATEKRKAAERKSKSRARGRGPPIPGRFAYQGLERILHEKARLGIMTSLVSQPDGLLFANLKELCALTDGNLSRHLQILHEAGLVELWKGYSERRPQTLCRLTPQGRKRFVGYLKILETVIRDALPRAAGLRSTSRDVPPGWVAV